MWQLKLEDGIKNVLKPIRICRWEKRPLQNNLNVAQMLIVWTFGHFLKKSINVWGRRVWWQNVHQWWQNVQSIFACYSCTYSQNFKLVGKQKFGGSMSITINEFSLVIHALIRWRKIQQMSTRLENPISGTVYLNFKNIIKIRRERILEGTPYILEVSLGWIRCVYSCHESLWYITV